MLTLNPMHMSLDRQITLAFAVALLHIVCDSEKLLFCQFFNVGVFCCFSSFGPSFKLCRAQDCLWFKLFWELCICKRTNTHNTSPLLYIDLLSYAPKIGIRPLLLSNQPMCPSRGMNVFIMGHNLFKFSQIFIKYVWTLIFRRLYLVFV